MQTSAHSNGTQAEKASIRVGTRGSALALAQAHLVQRLLDERAATTSDVVTMTTAGDRFLDTTLTDIGGKGLFTKEIDEALLDGRVDIAVHSCKDMPTALPDGLCFGAILEREDVRDVFFSPKAPTFNEIRPGMVIGTASLRRKVQVLHHHPQAVVVPFRGNVGTRLKKLDSGEADGTLLALAGLNRLNLPAQDVIGADVMLPAVAQGAIAIVCREGDEATRRTLSPLHHATTAICVTAERALLKTLDGSCKTPIAGLATLNGDSLTLKGMLAAPDASRVVYRQTQGAATDAEALGQALGQMLRAEFGTA